MQNAPQNFVSSGSEDLFGAEHARDSENEDLRGVIDDLTVENKRLKKLLRSRRSSSDISAPIPRDRLFELRVHGLSAEKKRELESLLRNFTTNANHPTVSTASSSATYGSATTPAVSSGSSSWNRVPQPIAKLHPTDSGYASNSQSGTASAAVSNGGKSNAPVSRSSRNKSIKNYLHDIPDTLLPRQSPFMSEKAKQILIVRRLEQLFTGKTAQGEHSQPIQQQEVSNSAAKAEAHPGFAKSSEGTREAHVLHPNTNINLDSNEPDRVPNKKSGDSDGSENVGFTQSRPGSPEQRPTRPLDLDIHRAQVASDNISYIRHLGLSTPHVQVDSESHEDSWIYLNLLVGMAQLHTLNVTPSLVRKALKKYSTKFEVSGDGKHVRWRGGNEGTAFTHVEEKAIEALVHGPAEAAEDNTGGGSSKRSKTNSSSNAMLSEEPSSEDKTSGLQSSGGTKQQASTNPTSNLQSSKQNMGTTTRSNFGYKPLVYKGKKYSAAASYLESTSSSSPSGESGELVDMLSRSQLEQTPKSQEGMITFFNNPYFCSDASADKSLMNWKPQRPISAWECIGAGQPSNDESPLRHSDACYFTPQFAPKPYQGPFDEEQLGWDARPISSAGEPETQPMEFEASGIGGVSPRDNFALDVKVIRRSQDPRRDPRPAFVPLTGSRKRKRYSYRTASCLKLELQPSKLPPPSYVFFTSSSSSADPAVELSESDSSSSVDEDYPAPAPFLNQWSTGSSDVAEEEGFDSESVDMLELAREAAPETIAAQERAFLMSRPGRVEGSLAATVGASRTSSSHGDIGMNDVSDEESELSVKGDNDD
jgi:hypothetical protein